MLIRSESLGPYSAIARPSTTSYTTAVMAQKWRRSSSSASTPSLLLSLQVAVLLLRLPIAAVADAAVNNNSSSLANLVENGSFEDGAFSPSTPGDNDEILTIPSQQTNITGWLLTSGSIDWARRRWKRASDCSATCIDLSGGGPGTVTTSFQTKPNTAHTILLDATANPDAPTPVKGTFTVSVLLGSGASVNSSNISVDGDGYNSNNIGWHTFAVFFTTPSTLQGNLTLSLSSNIQGWYGPLIDNVRVSEGLHYVNSEKVATCPEDIPKDAKSKVTLIVAILVPLFLVILLCMGVLLWRKQKRNNFRDAAAMPYLEGRLRIFPYSVLKNATQNFHQDCKLGEGTFGAVYKGILADESEVAVKQLFSKTPQGQDEFLNEAMVISSVQHRNLVTLKGCCAKGLERFLVYEYVENKSLHQVLWGSEGVPIHLNWPTRFRIVLGTAQGLAYLHEASQPRIIHRDIKASNILLDKNFEAKIGDFGLAKLFPDDKTHVSTRIAGTLGYLAPEYAMRGQLSEKADVFSFGVVALELVSGRKNLDYRLPLDNQYLLDWAKQLHSQGRMECLIDPELQAESYPKEQVTKVIKVGLLCTQEVAAMRPTMNQAVSLLQGSSEQDENVWNYVGKSNMGHLEAPDCEPLLVNTLLSQDNKTSTIEHATCALPIT